MTYFEYLTENLKGLKVFSFNEVFATLKIIHAKRESEKVGSEQSKDFSVVFLIQKKVIGFLLESLFEACLRLSLVVIPLIYLNVVDEHF